MEVGSKEHFLEELRMYGEELYGSFKSYDQIVDFGCIPEFIYDFGHCKFQFAYGDRRFIYE